jgi:hypothetical protein
VSGAGVHLLAADDDVVTGPLIAVCGELVDEPGNPGGDGHPILRGLRG